MNPFARFAVCVIATSAALLFDGASIAVAQNQNAPPPNQAQPNQTPLRPPVPPAVAPPANPAGVGAPPGAAPAPPRGPAAGQPIGGGRMPAAPGQVGTGVRPGAEQMPAAGQPGPGTTGYLLRGPMRPPFPQLNPTEQAELDHILAAWEQASEKISTLTASFTLFEYDGGTFRAKGAPEPKPVECSGEIHFAAPDKGYYKVTKGPPQHWVCDGKSMWEFDFTQKRLKEYKLPKELQGKAITNGPLPFVFGAKSDALKQRYLMHIITPPDRKGEIWIEAYPRWQQDAADFHHVQIILDSSRMLPMGIQKFEPTYDPARGENDNARKVYMFANHKVNGAFETLKAFFDRPMTPFGWKHEVIEPPKDALPQADRQPAAAADARARQLPARQPLKK